MELFEKTFVEWWKSMTPSEQDRICIIISDKCNTALSTVRSWGSGYRTPKSRSQDIIVSYLKENNIKADCETLFPN